MSPLFASLETAGETGRYVRDFDWSTTPVGAMGDWPVALAQAVTLMMPAQVPIVLLWGAEGVMIYNDAYADFAGSRHPGLLGKPVREAWSEIADFNDNVVRTVLTGQTLRYKDKQLTLERKGGEPKPVWMDLDYSPVLGDDGTPAGVMAIVVETTDRVRSASELRDREERFRSVVDTANVGLIQVDCDDNITFINDYYCEMVGRDRTELARTKLGDITHPEDREATSARMRDIFAGGRPFVAEKRYVRPEGNSVWVNCSVNPIRDAASAVIGATAASVDVTRQVEAERLLLRNEARLRVLIEGIPQLVWRADNDGYWVWSSPQWRRYTGQSAEESLGHGWLAAFHPEDRDDVLVAWREAGFRRGLAVDARIHNAATGAYCWFTTRASPARDDAGNVTEWLGTCTDIHELRLLQDRQKVLLRELQHRVRNTLSVIRAIARKTAATSTELDEYVMHLDGRLAALARAQAIVTRDPLGGLDLETMLLDEIQALGGSSKVSMKGPVVKLTPKAGEMLNLAIHELATNALKYGAFSQPGGHLAIDWTMDTAANPPMLRIRWIESTEPGMAAPGRRKGFGMELLTRTLPYDLRATTGIEWTEDGMRCVVTLPLDEVTVPA